MNSFERILTIIKRKIYLIIGRSILALVKNTGSSMKLQLTGLKDEAITDIERFSEFGLESYPLEGAECLLVSIDGNRENGIVLCVHDNRYRPKDLIAGETSLYNSTAGVTVKLKNNMVIVTAGGTLEFAPLASKIKAIVDDMISKYNSHVHNVTAVGSPTSTPMPPNGMTVSAVTAYQSTEVKIS